jgi:hypothetical protein
MRNSNINFLETVAIKASVAFGLSVIYISNKLNLKYFVKK